MGIKLVDFKVEEFYNIYTEKAGYVTGVLVAKNQVESKEGMIETLMMYVPKMDQTTFVELPDVKSYFWLDRESEKYGSKVYDSYFDKYGIKHGDNMASVLSIITEKWKDLDKEEREEIAEHLNGGMNQIILIDMITVISNQSKHLSEAHERYMDLLKTYTSVYEKEAKSKGVLFGHGTI